MVRNITVLIIITVLACIAISVSLYRNKQDTQHVQGVFDAGVPHVGNVQILNGSGTPGVANKVADYLRAKSFDVKNIGNAPTWNYEFTIVVARTDDPIAAKQIAGVLHTDKVITMRDSLSIYDVDVFVGGDYAERIK